MRRSSRFVSQRVLYAVAFTGVCGWTAWDSTPALAQNTYLDAPFNQGSLFYRPSGRRAPRTVVTRPAPVYAAAPVPYAAAPRVYAPYVAAAPAAVVAAPRAQAYYPARRGFFRRYFWR